MSPPRNLAGGVASSWQAAPPCPVWVHHGLGSRLWDVDGTEYVDLHNGFGAMLVGHAHPAVVQAVQERVALGSHFAQPTEDLIAVSAELARRFGLPLWRFGNSGTESTMDAIHLMRAKTGRSRIIKVEGTYHGHHDSVQVCVYPDPRRRGTARVARTRYRPKPASRPISRVSPSSCRSATSTRSSARCWEYPDEIAGMILEPMMMNIGIIAPPDGYLAGLVELLHAARRVPRASTR